MRKLVVKIEAGSKGQRHVLRSLKQELEAINPETRRRTADLILAYGLGTHIGGHHVAVHEIDRFGNIDGPRLAIITSNAPDFS
jgi:hypothetical protein